MKVLYWLESIRAPWLDAVMLAISQLGGEILFMAIVIALFWCMDKRKGYYLMTVGFFGIVANQFLKLVFRVSRPWIRDPEFTIVEGARAGATGYSFPSGHTQNAAAVLGCPARMARKKGLKITLWVLYALVGISRMYLGVHTPYDVGVGVVMGLVLVFGLYPFFSEKNYKPQRMYVLLGVMLLSLGAYGRVKLHGIYDQQLLSRRSDSLITDSTNLVKTTAEALAGTNNSLRTKISSGLSSKSRSVKNTAAQMLTTGSSDQETLAFIVDTLSQAAVSKLKDDDEAQSALKIAVTEKLSAERDNIIATVLADTNAQIQAMSIEDVRRSLTMQTSGYTMMFYSILMLWVGGVLLALGVGLGLVRYLGSEDLRKKVTDIVEPMDYLLPFFFGVIVFTLYPMVRVFIMAFQQRYKLTGEFAGWGLGNFSDVLHGIGTNLPQAIGNTFLYVILIVPISTAIALLLAYLLNQKIKLRALFQTAYFLPMVTSATAVGLVWKYMFQENYGLINWLLSLFDVAKIPWLTKSAYSMAVMVIYGIWDALPFTIILLISGLQNIDDHYYTVAKVDGARAKRIFFRITVPLLSPTIGLVLIINSISAFKVFNSVVVLFSGSPGPNNNMYTMTYYIYEQINTSLEYGRAAAASLILFVIILLFTMLQRFIQRKWKYD